MMNAECRNAMLGFALHSAFYIQHSELKNTLWQQ